MINTPQPKLPFDRACQCCALGVIWLLLWAYSAAASPRSADICDQAAQIAAAESTVPLSVLRSITRTETGRTRNGALQPWPWTVNMEGIGKWFDTKDAARAYVFRHFKRGARSFDVGCFQINYKWHGAAFRSIDEMFDPVENARYAAQFLARLHAETGDWSKAAGAYHSRTPKYATKYRTRFDRIRRDLQGAPMPPVGARDIARATPGIVAKTRREPRVNTYPLLIQSVDAGHRGSLVPLGQGGGTALIRLDPSAQGS